MAPSWGREGGALAIHAACSYYGLLDFPATFLPVSLACQSLFDPQFLTRLQIEGMPLDLFNDVFLLHLPLEAPKGVFQGFTVLESDFCQNLRHLQTDQKFYLPNLRRFAKVLISYDLIGIKPSTFLQRRGADR